jgi:hypothetical protein
VSIRHTSDRADASVWMPLLAILGGIAQRVAQQRAEELPDEHRPAGPKPTASEVDRRHRR